jgi:hypothetical protein
LERHTGSKGGFLFDGSMRNESPPFEQKPSLRTKTLPSKDCWRDALAESLQDRTCTSSVRPAGVADPGYNCRCDVALNHAKNGTKIKTEITIMKRIKIKTKIKIRRNSRRVYDRGTPAD